MIYQNRVSQYITILRYPVYYWCRRRDLNPYVLKTQAPQTCVSANSTTSTEYTRVNTNSFINLNLYLHYIFLQVICQLNSFHNVREIYLWQSICTTLLNRCCRYSLFIKLLCIKILDLTFLYSNKEKQQKKFKLIFL